MAYQGAYAKIDRERYEKYNKKEETVPQEPEAASKQGEASAAKQNNMQESEVQNVSEQNDKSEAQTSSDTQEKTQEQNNADGTQQKQTEQNEDEPVVISPSALKKLQAESGIKNDDVSHDSEDVGYDDDNDENYYYDGDDEDDYEESENKSVDNTPVADTPVKQANKSANKKPVQPSSRRVSKNNTEVKGNSVIRNFPKSIMNYVKNKFSVETRQEDILAAYIYIAAGKPVDMEISDNVKTVVDSYCGEDITIRDLKEEILTKLDNLKEMIRKDDNFIKTKLNEIELAVVYSLYCHFDWLKDEPESAGDVKFLEQGINDLFRALGRDAEAKRLRDAVKNGTPIR